MTLLAHLSIQRVTGHRRPHVLTNEERVRAFRAYQPVQFANAALNDQLRAIEYARAETSDGRIPTTEEYDHEL